MASSCKKDTIKTEQVIEHTGQLVPAHSYKKDLTFTSEISIRNIGTTVRQPHSFRGKELVTSWHHYWSLKSSNTLYTLLTSLSSSLLWTHSRLLIDVYVKFCAMSYTRLEFQKLLFPWLTWGLLAEQQTISGMVYRWFLLKMMLGLSRVV